MKKLISILLLAIFLISCSSDEQIKDEITQATSDELVFWHITDTHYLAPSLNQDSPDFTQMMLGADGKMTHYSHDMTLALKDEVLSSNPDVVLITGDLTFNGEKESHLNFADILEEIEDNGTTVLTFPGNHDIDYPFAYAYIDDKVQPAENISMEDFADIYKDFGLSEAIYKDEASLSYIYKYNKDLYFLAIDTSSSGNGIILDETLTWLDTALALLPKDSTIISMTHQSLFVHNDGFESGFVINEHSKLADILRKYNVELNLSGHMHIQNILTQDGLTDIATGANSLFFTRYAIIQYNKGELSYSSHSIDVDAYAKNNDIKNQDLLNFTEYSKDFYYQSAYLKGIDSATNLNFSDEDSVIFADFIAKMNEHYFYGDLSENLDILKEHEGYKLISNLETNSFIKSYIDTVINAEIADDLNWSNKK